MRFPLDLISIFFLGSPIVNTAKRRLYLGMLKVFNLGLMVAAFGIATVLLVRQQDGGVPLSDFLSVRVKLINFVTFSLILLAWHGIFSLCGQYQSQRLARRRSVIANATSATTIASLFLGVVAMVFRISMVTPQFLFLFWICASMLVAGSRVLIRSCLEIVRVRGRNLRYILILGTNRRAIEFARRLDATPEWGYRVLGFVDQEWHEGADLEKPYPLCCSFDGLAEYLRRNVVDEVANYLPLRSFYEHSSGIAALCEQHGIFMRFDPEIFDLKIARARAEELDGRAHITAYSSPLDGWPVLVKRILDVTLSLALLVVVAPVLVVIGLMVKLTSRGPILFRQERIGRNKRRFFIYKFRTMVPNAEKLLPALEVLNEAARTRIQDQERSANDADWPAAQTHQPRRTAAAIQRAAGRYESSRSPASCPCGIMKVLTRTGKGGDLACVRALLVCGKSTDEAISVLITG